jgi:uncharacterized protein YbbC (DUF1343 family)
MIMKYIFILIIFIVSLSQSFAMNFGIDRLETLNLTGKKIGLLCHSASVNKFGKHLIDLTYPKFNVVKIFAPEHGLRSLNDEWINDGIDEQTKLPVISLYKQASRAPKKEDLQNLDTVIIDLQDVGMRYYTYFSTIAEFIKVAGPLGIEIIILDRPNLLGGTKIEGEVLDLNLQGNFISYYNIPTRHGMTLGEITSMLIDEQNIPAKLQIVKVDGWYREILIQNLDRQWRASSPALQNLEQVYLYNLWGTLESFNLSVGRGLVNDLAFKVIAAPWITNEETIELAQELNQLSLKGMNFEPIRFLATRDIYKDQYVQGVKISLATESLDQRMDEMTFKIASHLKMKFQERIKFSKMAVNYYGSQRHIEAITKLTPWENYQAIIDQALTMFEMRRLPYLIY